MIRSCINYLTENDTLSIWDQPLEQSLSKLAECMELNTVYQEAYRVVGEAPRDEVQHQPIFRFSKLQLFGEFNEFSARLQGITFILESFRIYQCLPKLPIESEYHRVSSIGIPWRSKSLLNLKDHYSIPNVIAVLSFKFCCSSMFWTLLTLFTMPTRDSYSHWGAFSTRLKCD